MTQKPDPKLIGAFVLGALALAVAVLVVFGTGNIFASSQKYVAYFQGSVDGLSVGAPVKLKGVSIGSVRDVLVQYDMANNRVLTPVVLEIDISKVMDIRENHRKAHPPSIQELIDRGLRARLSLQSLVTGQLFVDFDFRPERPVRMAGSSDLRLPEIPTIPSSKEEIANTIDEAITEFRKLPIKETFDATLHSVRHIENLLAAPETRASIGNLNQTLTDLHKLIGHLDSKVDSLAQNLDGTVKDTHTLVQNLNRQVVPLLGTTEKTLGSAAEAFAQAKAALEEMESINGQDAPLNTALRDFSDAAYSLRILADYLERNPDALIYGRGKAPLND
jgi:paraquat-inducible protein B